jgi:arginine decarboxylase
MASARRAGSLLGQSGPVASNVTRPAYSARIAYTVLNGTSASNRTIMTACVGDGEIALCDRNCHKSIEQGLALTGGIPVFITPTRNRYGIIGPASPASLEPPAIEKSIAANPLAKNAANKRPVYSVLTNCTYDGMCYDSAQVESRLAKSVDRIHLDEAWYGYARFNPLYKNRFAMRDAPDKHPKDGPTVFATHSTHKLLAALSQTRGFTSATARERSTTAASTRHCTRHPPRRFLLIASNDVAAAMMDGPRACAHAGDHRRSSRCRLATARCTRNSRRRRTGFAPWNAPEIKDAKSGKKVPFHEAGRAARHRSGMLGTASGESGTASTTSPTAGACSIRSFGIVSWHAG